MRLCKDSTNPLCHGWPGGMNAWSVSCSLAQRPGVFNCLCIRLLFERIDA